MPAANHVLFVFAHQDDEVGAATRIQYEVGQGAVVHCVFLTDGGLGGASPAQRDAESLRVLTALGVDPARIVVMGESAGGGLAAALALMARDRGGPSLAGQVLIYPMLDWRTGGPDDLYRNRHTGEFVWTRAKNRYGWEALRGDYRAEDERKAWFSPALAEDLSGLPPAYISTGALDLFLDEDLDYARRLIDCGVQTELHVYPGAIHAFEMVPGTGLAEQAAMDLRRGLDRLLR